MSDISMGNKNSSNVSNSRIGKRVLSIGLAAVLVLSSIVVALPVKNAYAAVSIATSVDNFGRQFYGPALVRVVIEDSDAKGSGNVNVNISVDGKASPQQFTAKETGLNTGVFELFIAANTDARPQSPTVTTNTSIVRIYNGASDDVDGDSNTVDKGFSVDLQKNDKIRISYSTLPDVVLTYSPTPATLTVDRTLVGDQNLIRLKLKDPDANLDPTGVDKFTLSQTDNITEPGLDIDATNGALWQETGTNTGVFELIVKVNSNDPTTTSKDNQVGLPGITFPSSALFKVKDNEVYHKNTDSYPKSGDTLANAKGPFASTLPITTTSTVSTTVQLRNSDGSIDLAAPLTIANGFQIKVTDPDRNMDTAAKDNAIGSTTLNTTSPTSAPGSDTNALDGNVNYNITNGTTGLKVTTTGLIVSINGVSASGTITLTSTLTFTFTGGTSPAITGVTATIPAGDISITAPSGFNVTSKSGTATVTSGTTIQTIVNIGFSTTSAGTFTIANNSNPITVTVSGITVSGSPTAATLTSVTTTAAAATTVFIPVTFKETDDNTGVFLPDLAGNKIQIVPVAGGASDLHTTAPDPEQNIVTDKIVLGSDNKIYVLASAISEDIDLTISYNDPAADPTGSKTFSIVRKIQHFAGNISTTTTSVPVTGKAVIEINDMDLNLNPDAIDIYTLTYTNVTGGNSPSGAFNGLAALKIKVNGSTSITFDGGNTSIQLVETDKNTGVFKGELDVGDLDVGDIATPSLTDGDKITFEYEDNTESPTLTRSVDVKIGKPSGTVELDRSSYPPTTSLGTTKLHITITDPSFNSSSSSTDVLPIQKGRDDNAGTFDRGQLKIELIKSGDTLTFKPGDTGFPTSANETGVNTGVFTVDVNLPATLSGKDIDDGWQIRVVYKDDNGDEQTATATVTTNTAQITTDKPTYDLGQTIILRVIEPDWNLDSDKADEIQLSAINLKVDSDKVDERELEDPTLAGAYTLDPSNSLRETDKNSGIFEIKLKDINNKLVSRGKNLTFIYEDTTPSGGGDEIEVKHTVLITSATVDIMFDKEAYTPFDRVIVTIIDPGANTNSDSKDKLDASQGKGRVKVVVGGSSKTAGQEIDIFEETDNNSGVFKYKDSKGIKITDINSNAKPGDSIRVEYRSPDREVEISKSVPIIFNNGTISLDKDSYKPNETAVITINDPDENRDPDRPDQFEVKVVSTTDPAGIKVTVRETGDRTGVFNAYVTLTTDLSSGNRLQVREGDQITAIYTDETLPNAQTIKMELVNRDNVTDLRTLQTLDVQASAVVGVLLAPTERTTVAKPSLRDQAGNVLQQASVDVPVSIASSIKNNTQQPQKFVYIVQVKDADGFVVSISTVGGTLPAGQSFDVSASWTPTAAGTYTVEVFVWNELGKPSPLSKVETATVTVV